MTGTEERLRDALHASAARVRDDRLRPLPAPEPGAKGEMGRRRAWRALVMPAAAAAAVVLVIAVVVGVTGGPGPAARPGAERGGSGGTGKTTAGVPGYFAFFNAPDEHESLYRVVVLSTATGAMVASTPVLDDPSADPLSIAAAPGDRTFYVDYQVGTKIKIYTFRIPARGKTAPLTPVKGGVVNNTAEAGIPPTMFGPQAQLAVSPDGTQLALTTGTAEPATQMADEIVAINLRTGAHSVWRGGLDRPGKLLGIVNLSWAAGGQSLVFLAQWCDDHTYAVGYCSGANTPTGYRDAQVRSLTASTGGGSLDNGQLLLRQSAKYPAIAQAIAGPGGQGLTVVVLSGPVKVTDNTALWHHLAIDQISADGSPAGTGYQADFAGTVRLGAVMLDWDPSDTHLIFSEIGPQVVYARVAGGMLHRLPFSNPHKSGVFYGYSAGPIAW